TDIVKQIVFLHHTVDAGAPGDSVPNATVQITAPNGRVMQFARTVLTDCLTGRPATSQLGTCYASVTNSPVTITPATQYSLRVTLADGKVLTGVTTVPEEFHFVVPAAALTTCTIPVLKPLTL